MQHPLLENKAHYVDFPWRPANCLQATGLPDQNPAANVFYDIINETRRDLHRTYIRKCLDVLGKYDNVIHQCSEEYTGDVAFMQFWIDTIVEWEKENGKNVNSALLKMSRISYLQILQEAQMLISFI